MVVTGKLKMDDLKWHAFHKFIRLLFEVAGNEYWEIFDTTLHGAYASYNDNSITLTFEYKGEFIESITFNKDKTFCILKPDCFVYIKPSIGEILSWTYVIPATLESLLYNRDSIVLTGIILKIEENKK